jgi:hypothetical protein
MREQGFYEDTHDLRKDADLTDLQLFNRSEGLQNDLRKRALHLLGKKNGTLAADVTEKEFKVLGRTRAGVLGLGALLIWQRPGELAPSKQRLSVISRGMRDYRQGRWLGLI